MAEQRERTEQESKVERKQQYERLRNQFIVFYTLRHLWKRNKHKVNDLYKVLFPSSSQTGGNKTLYDNILSGKHDTSSADATHLAERIGINEAYFTGARKLTVTKVSDDEWKQFISLRQERGNDSKEQALKDIEDKIKLNINLTADDKSIQSEPFRRLLYFAQYGHKRVDKTLTDLFVEIEGKISECRPEAFESADLKLLEDHQGKIQTYLYHITAAITMKEWKQERKND